MISKSQAVILLLVGLALALFWWQLMALDRYGLPLRRAGALVRGHLLEVLLYGAYPKVMLRSLRDVVGASVRLSACLLWPSLWFTLPLLVGVVVANSVYAYRPVRVAESVVVGLVAETATPWKLQPSPLFEIEVDGFRHPLSPAVYWRIKPLAEGRLALVFQGPEKAIGKELRVDARPGGMLCRSRYPLGWSWLLAPLEAPLPSGLHSVSVEYPERVLSWNGWAAPWWALLLLAFLGWSWLLAFLGRPGNRSF